MRAALSEVFPKLPPLVWVYLITVVTPISFDVGPLAMTSLRLFLIVMIIPLLIQLLMGKFGKVFWTDYLFGLHVAWMIPVFLVNNPSSMVQQVGSVGLEFLGGYVMGRAYIRSPEAFLGLCKALIVLVFISVPFALVELRTGNPVIIAFLDALPGVRSATNVEIPGRMGMERVQNMFSHPIHYGLFCSVAFSLCMVALKGVISTPRRYISAAIVAFAGFTALSSGALLAITLQMALIIWATMLANVEKRWKILVGIIAVFYVSVDLASNRQPIDVFMSYATFSAHTAYWRAIIFEWGMKTVWNFPIFGIGQNNWVRPWFVNSGSVDNYWLLMAMRFGIPGMLLVASGYALGVARVMRRDFSHDPVLNLIRRAWVFTFLGLSFTLCTVHVWTYIYSFVFFMFGAGMFLITIPGRAPEDAEAQDAAPAAGSRFARVHTPLPSRPAAPTRDAPAPGRHQDGPSFTRFPKGK